MMKWSKTISERWV